MYSFCTFLQASIVTVIHLVNAVVDTVTNKGIVIMRVLCVCVTVTVIRVLLPTVVLETVLCDFEGAEYFYFVQIYVFIIQIHCKIFLSLLLFAIHSEFTDKELHHLPLHGTILGSLEVILTT